MIRLRDILEQRTQPEPPIGISIIFVSGLFLYETFEQQTNRVDAALKTKDFLEFNGYKLQSFKYTDSAGVIKALENAKEYIPHSTSSTSQVDALILYSKSCEDMNTYAQYIDKNNIYCIEPYNKDGILQDKFKDFPPGNLWIGKYPEAGQGLESSPNNPRGTNHVTAPSDVVPQIADKILAKLSNID